MGPSIKDVCTRGGRGVSQKRTHADAGGGRAGGQWQKADVNKIRIFAKIFEVLLVFCVLKDDIQLNN